MNNGGVPFIDAIITSYNRPKFLIEAVNSVANQSYPNINIIVVDDGSRYERLSEISAIKNSKRKVYYVYQKHNGISQARNTGIKVSRSEYLAFLDDDDLWVKKKIEFQMDVLLHTDYQICYTNEKWLRNGKHLNQHKKHQKYSGHIFDKVLPLCIISPSSILLKKKIFDGIGMFDTDFEVCEDYELWLRLALNHKIFFLDKPLIIKRGGHQDQLSKKLPAMDKYRIQALLKLLDRNSKTMSADKIKITVAEIEKKSKILIEGCKKRNLNDESEYYERIIEENKRKYELL